MKLNPIKIAYSDQYLDWQLGDEHLVNPIRDLVAMQSIQARFPDQVTVFSSWAEGYGLEKEKWVSSYTRLTGELVGELAPGVLTRFGGTYTLVEELIRDRVVEESYGVYFNPAGGESSAHQDVEVLNDLGYAVLRLTEAGLRVAYLDWDAHRDDRVEQLLLGREDITTVSMHEDPQVQAVAAESVQPGAVRLGLAPGAGDPAWLEVSRRAVSHLSELEIDVLVFNCGADGLEEDESSSLNLSVTGMAYAGTEVARFVADQGISVLVGGGGGHLPLDGTPEVWDAIVTSLVGAMVMRGAHT